MGHDIDIRVGTAEFRVDDDESYGPIGDTAQHYQKYEASKETGLANGIWQP